MNFVFAHLDDVRILEAAACIHRAPCGMGEIILREWRPDDVAAQAQPPVVLLHGGSGSWRHWLRNIPALMRDRRVIAVDMPGYGDSASPPEPVDFPALGRIIAAAVDPLIGDAGYHLAGFSLGSFVAPNVAAAFSSRLRSLILIHGHFWGVMRYTPRGTLKRWRNVEDRDERREILRYNLGQLMLAHPESADDLTLDVYAADLEKARLRVETFIGTLDTTLLNRLDAPILAVSGALDPTGIPDVAVQQERLRAARETAGGVPVECVVLENVGHWAMWEAPQAIDVLLMDWLQRRS